MTEVLVRHHSTFYSMIKSKMASVGHIDKLSIDHVPIIGWVYRMKRLMQVCFLKHPRRASKNARAAFRNLGKQPQTPPLKPPNEPKFGHIWNIMALLRSNPLGEWSTCAAYIIGWGVPKMAELHSGPWANNPKPPKMGQIVFQIQITMKNVIEIQNTFQNEQNTNYI